jgi:hypothetical protein
MKNQQQNVRLTRIKIKNETMEKSQIEHKPKKHDIYLKIHNATDTMHTNQTGCFPATPSLGNKYIMVLVKVDGNYMMRNQ